jgi:catechol 2,3-dioxygenase-like lactoylglutathione lyase family enzyme
MTNSCKSSRDVIIRTDNSKEAIAFYESVLGFRISDRFGEIIGFETGAFRLYVEEGKPHGPVFDFLVANVAETKERLLANGCVLIEENPAVPRCYLMDPFGLVFNIGLAEQG